MAGKSRPRALPEGPRLAELEPMLLDERPFDYSQPGWQVQLKFDGYRLMGEFGDGTEFLKTRGGADATAWFPEVAQSLRSIGAGRHVVDGEVCVLDELGRSDFDRLHARARRRRWVPGGDAVVYCIFDLLVANGRSLLNVPLSERQARLDELFSSVPAPASVMVMGHFDAAEEGEELFRRAVLPLKLEGLVAKRSNSIYQPGVRSPDWVKIKRKGATPAQRFDRGDSAKLP